MTLLGDLISDAAKSTVPVQELLRRLKVVASRSKTAELAEWVGHELSGYPSGSAVPEYRGPIDVPVLGHLTGPFRTEAKNVPIPPLALPERLRKGDLFSVTFRESVAELDRLQQTDELTLQAPWPANTIAFVEYYRERGEVTFGDGMNSLVGAKRIIPVSLVVGVLDTVRSRILDLALSFEDIAPAAGESKATPEQSAQMSQTFITHVYGGGQAAIASTNVQQVQVNRGDEGALLAALSAAGVDPDSLEELKKALAEDRAENGGDHPAEPGPRVSRWWTRWGLKAAGFMGAVASGAGGDMVAQALGGFFGMS